jgi:hypothetical protein
VLGTLSDPVPEHEPFLFYNGKFGTDSAGIIFHRGWFWPEGRGNNPYGIITNQWDTIDPDSNRWADDDPYVTIYNEWANMPWPPNPEYLPSNGPYTFYVDINAPNSYSNNVTGDTWGQMGTANWPFINLMSAYSFVPKGGTISMAAGTYTMPAHPVPLTRACTITATGGTVLIQ